MRICCVVGARPNFPKIAPILRALEEVGIDTYLIHTGQHYDYSMSEVFFQDLSIPKPNTNLQIKTDSSISQIASALKEFSKLNEPFDYLLVVGDVNSSLALALAGGILKIPVIHVEAGLRSFDRSMPEELNRVLIDHIASIHFTTEESANLNLIREGINNFHFVGNVMIDSLVHQLSHIPTEDPLSLIKLSNTPSEFLGENSLAPRAFGLVTLHRESNALNQDFLSKFNSFLIEASIKLPIIFPAHPRLNSKLSNSSNLLITPPLSYKEFTILLSNAKWVLTDSGGIQEEASYLGIPCFTLRSNTERPVTLSLGSNRLVGNNLDLVRELINQELSYVQPNIPLWDGQTAKRIAAILRNLK